MEMADKQRWAEVFQKAKKDVIIYNGDINQDGAYKITQLAGSSTNKSVELYLTPYGGSPDAGYKIANILQEKYESFEIIINGF